MRRILVMAREDLRLTLRDRSMIFWIFIAPLIWVYMFGALNRASDNDAARVSLEVVQNDPGPEAEAFIRNLSAANFAVTTRRPSQPPPAEPLPRSLEIPADFGEAIAARRKMTLTLATAPKADEEATMAAELAVERAILRTLAGEAFGGMEPAADIVTVRSNWATDRPIPVGFYQTVPGNLVMFVLLSTVTYGAALLVQERNNGILKRLASSPARAIEILLGKVAGRAMVASVQVAVFIAIGTLLCRIDWGRSPLGLAALLGSMIVCASAIGLMCGALFASPGAASGFGVTATLVMSAFGGCWWPAEVMPEWMQRAGYAFPTTWALDGMHRLISWGGGARDILPNCAVLLLMGALAGAVAARRIRAAL